MLHCSCWKCGIKNVNNGYFLKSNFWNTWSYSTFSSMLYDYFIVLYHLFVVGSFVEIIRNRGNALISLLSEVCNNKQEQLDKKQEVLQHLGGQADHCTQVLNAVLDTSSDTALLYTKKWVRSAAVTVCRLTLLIGWKVCLFFIFRFTLETCQSYYQCSTYS